MDLNQAVICLLSRWLTMLYIVHHGRCFDTYSQSVLQGYIKEIADLKFQLFNVFPGHPEQDCFKYIFVLYLYSLFWPIH